MFLVKKKVQTIFLLIHDVILAHLRQLNSVLEGSAWERLLPFTLPPALLLENMEMAIHIRPT